MKAHIWNSGIDTLPDMGESTRRTLAVNLGRLMDESEALKTIKQLSAQTGVSTGTIDRIRRGQVSVGVDNLDAIAAAFGLEPWQMLVPGIKANEKLKPGVGLSEESVRVAASYENMTAVERERLRLLMLVAHDGATASNIRPTLGRELSPDRSQPSGDWLGGMSNFGELDEAKQTKKGAKGGKS